MKIDMLAMAFNFASSEEIKIDKSNGDFFKVLNSKMEGSISEKMKNMDETENIDGESNTEEDLIALMTSILNSLGSLDNTQAETFENDPELTINLELVKDIVTKAQEIEDLNLETIEKFFSGSEVEEFFDELNLNLDELGLSKEQKKQLFLKLLNRISEGKEASHINGEVELKTEEFNKFQDVTVESFMDYQGDDKVAENKDNLFEVGNFKHRNIIVEEKPSNPQGELSLLNRIAFSSSNITETPKETAPVVVRNEFLGSDVLNVVKYISNNKIEELNVKITPRELGEVNIKLLKAEENNELIITLTNKNTYELIKENVADIEKHLASLDIKIKEVVVQVKNEVFSDMSGSFNEQFGKNSSGEGKKNNFSKECSSLEEEQENQKDESNINLLV
ncbi:MAG: flagellar hook-length control protein FliK [Clostridium sp.]